MSARILNGPKVSFREETRGLGQFFFEQAEKYANNICQVDATTDKKETFGSVKKRSTLAAIHMRKLGVSSDDVVLFCSKNTLDNIIPVAATLYLGAKVTSVDPSMSTRECVHFINIVKPRFIFAEEASEGLLEDSIKEAKSKATLIIIGVSKKYRSFAELQVPSPEESTFKPVIKNCHETAFINFSSGTTGLPKGICLTSFGLINSMKVILQMDYIKPDVVMHLSSLYWLSAVLLTTLTFIKGGCRVFSRTPEPEKFLELVQKYKITYTFMAPVYSYGITSVANPDQYDTSSLRCVALVGCPMNKEQLVKTRKVLKNSVVVLNYGTTECCGYVTGFDCTRHKDLFEEKLASSGLCAPELQLKVVDVETRQLLGPNQKGELCFKTKYSMGGYYNMDSTSCYDEEGFVLSGDIGYYDEDECVYVIDRIKEMFKYRSWHVVPSFLELILQEHPAVKEATVFGIPHEEDEFHPAACVVLKDNATASVKEIDDFFSGKVAEWHKLRGGIKILEVMPRSPTGKIQRRIVRDYFLKGEF